MANTLQQKLDDVCDENTFIAFVSALSADRADEVKKEKMKPSSPYGAGANGWQNGSIEAFLDAAAAWAEFKKKQNPAENPWKRCAEILYAGKFYE